MEQKIKVDFTKQTGKIKPMHAVNNVPCMPYDTHENNLFAKLQEAGVPYGRLHDTGGRFGGAHFVDIENIFPDFDADETDPASYDFAFTDRLLEEMVKYGIEPFFRLGATIENFHFLRAYHIYPPKDFHKWARICAGIVRHYNEGWAGGYHFGIRYWEIWNEPDNTPDVEDNPMWKGTPEQFFEMYDITARHLKALFPSIRVGGYGSCGFYAINTDSFIRDAHSSPRVGYFIDFMDRFLEYCQKNGTVLDFFSWHSYADVEDNVRYAAYARKKLEQYGYGGVEIFLNEWNPGIAEKGRLRDAANIAAGMCALQKTSTDMCMYYDAQITSTYCGLFNFTTHDVYKAYYAFFGFHKLYQLSNEAFSETGAENVYVCAAVDGFKGGVLLVNRNMEECRFSLAVKGANPDEAVCYAVDEAHDFEQISWPGSTLTMQGNALWYVEFKVKES